MPADRTSLPVFLLRMARLRTNSWMMVVKTIAQNPKLTTATCPASLRTKIGPLSRTHESSIGMGSGSTVAPQRFRTSVSSPGLQIIVSGSKPAIARATPA